MQGSTRTKVLVGLAIFVIAAVAVWWYFGFTLEFMKFFASEESSVSMVVCNPPTQTIQLVQEASFVATNGSGTYEWFSPEGATFTGSGQSYTVRYNTVGIKKVTVQSARGVGSSTIDSVACAVIVQ